MSALLETHSAAVADWIESGSQYVAALRSRAYRTTSAVVLADGLLAANHHEVRREDGIPVLLPDGNTTKARVVGREPGKDIAILKTEDALPVRESASSTKPRVGELIAIVGRTMDVGISAGIGILGAVGESRQTWRGGELGMFLRLDANVYPSQSGAGVLSARGELLGMLTPALLRHAALAIPIATLELVAARLLKGGRIRKGYLGVALSQVPLPQRLRDKTPLAGESGLMAWSVEPASGAEAAGIQLGDIFVAVNGTPLTEPQSLLAALGDAPAGTAIKVTLFRAGGPLEVDIVLSERTPRA